MMFSHDLENALKNGTRGISNNALEVDLKTKSDWDLKEGCVKNDFSEFVISYNSPCVKILETHSLSETFECKKVL